MVEAFNLRVESEEDGADCRHRDIGHLFVEWFIHRRRLTSINATF